MEHTKFDDARASRADVVGLIGTLLGGKHPVLNGDGWTIFKQEFYLSKVPAEYHDDIMGLNREHNPSLMDDPDVTKGVYSMDVHFWAASKIKKVDDTFWFPQKIGKGFQCASIVQACRTWVSRQKCRPPKREMTHEDKEGVEKPHGAGEQHTDAGDKPPLISDTGRDSDGGHSDP